MPKLELLSTQPVQGPKNLDIGAAAEVAADRAQYGAVLAKQGRDNADIMRQASGARANSFVSGSQAMGGAYAEGSAAHAKISADLGHAMEDMGTAYYQQAQQAMDDAVFNDVYAKASVEYNTKVQQRIAKPYDEAGNPTFASLPQDIASIGQEVSEQYSGRLINPNIRSKFNGSFTALQANQQIAALREGRNQQMSYSLGSLDSALTAGVTNGLSSPRDQIGLYYNQGMAQIDSAVSSGVISPSEGVGRKEKLRQNLYGGSLEILNSKDPRAVQELLNSSQELGITPQERLDISSQNKSALNQQRIEAERRVNEHAAVVKEAQNFNSGELKMGITKGQVNETDIENAYSQGKISHDQRVSLTESVYKSQGLSAKTIATRTSITQDIQTGTVLSNYSPAEIDDHFQARVALATKNGQSPDLTQKAMWASDYKAPVPILTKEISQTFRAGSPEQISKAVEAFTVIQAKNPIAIQGMDQQSIAFASVVSSQLKYTKTDPALVIANAKKSVFEADNNITSIRRGQFGKQEEFKSENLQNTIAKIYGLNSILGDDKVSNGIVPVVQDLLRNAYELTGDTNAALEMVKNQTAGIIGTSDVNKTSGLLKDKKTLMFLPPEKAYGVDAESLRSDLNKALRPAVLPSTGRPIVYNDDGTISTERSITITEPDINGGKPTNIPTIWDGKELSPQQATDRARQAIKQHVSFPMFSFDTIPEAEAAAVARSASLGKEADSLRLLPPGIDPSQVFVGSDEVTKSQSKSPTYQLYYVDQHGAEVPLINKDTGQPIRWKPDLDQIKHDKLEAAQTLRNEVIDSRTNIPTGPGHKILPPRAALPYDTQSSQMAMVKTAIATTESSNNYAALGATLRNGDRALGRYQIMGNNLPAWSKEAVGRVVTASEFIRSPHLQDKIFEFKMGQLLANHSTEDALSIWHSGRPLAEAKARGSKDQANGLSTSDYVSKTMASMGDVPEEAKTQSADHPQYISSSDMNVASAPLLSMPSTVSTFNLLIGMSLAEHTKDKAGTPYVFGGKSTAKGGIDCSGWVAENTLQAMQSINQARGGIYDIHAMSKILSQGAAWQIASIGKLTGFMDNQKVLSGQISSGTLIGIRRKSVPGWAANRPMGISHVVQVVEKNGQKFISESVGSKGGVSLTPYRDWVKTIDASALYAVNPFALVSTQLASM